MARGTVKTHLEHIFAKTGYSSRAELTVATSRRQSQPQSD
jgi:DNA-binding CsgD family transcriptional regulator